MRTAPTATCCQKGCTPTMMKPLPSTAGMKTPKTVPRIVPIPPNSDVPPMTTPAIALRLSVECPPTVVVEKRDAAIERMVAYAQLARETYEARAKLNALVPTIIAYSVEGEHAPVRPARVAPPVNTLTGCKARARPA